MRRDVGSLIRYLRRLTPPAEGDSDGLLLDRFVDGDEDAFAALLQRHGALVWGVCVRTLPMAHDAEDAFQAVFLVLARKAGGLRRAEPLAPWLHRVAWRTAQKARARRLPCVPVEERPHPMDPSTDLLNRELRGLIDEEIDRLPERYRPPVLLCLVEGLTNEEAAARLGCPVGTVQSRLSRARDRLRRALARRGIEAPATLGALSASAVPAHLLRSSLPSVASSAAVSALAKGVLLTMTLKRFEVVLVLLAFTLAGSGAWFGTRPGTPPSAIAEAVKPEGKGKEKEPPKDMPPAIGEQPLAETVSQIRKALDKKIVFESESNEAKLGEILETLRKKYRVQFTTDEGAFKQSLGEEPPNVLETKIGVIGPIHTSLDRVLHSVLSRVPGTSRAIYLVRKDCLEITTEKAAREELGVHEKPTPDGESGERVGAVGLLPLISEDFVRTDLEDVLKKFSETSGYNVILDPRARKQNDAKSEITMQLLNVPVDVAVDLVAEMNGLAVVRRANVYFVTTEKIAEKMRKDREKEAGFLGGRPREPRPRIDDK